VAHPAVIKSAVMQQHRKACHNFCVLWFGASLATQLSRTLYVLFEVPLCGIIWN